MLRASKFAKYLALAGLLCLSSCLKETKKTFRPQAHPAPEPPPQEITKDEVSSDSEAQLPPVKEEEVWLFLLVGQSNMAGLGLNAELPPEFKVEGKVDIFTAGHAGFLGWGKIRPGLGFKSKYFGPELSFAQEMAAALPTQRVALVKIVYGDTSLYADWCSPSSGLGICHDWTAFSTELKSALQTASFKQKIKWKGIVWMQGESDSRVKLMTDSYAENLKAILSDFRSALGDDTVPVILGKIDVQDIWVYADRIRAAQDQVSRELHDVSTVDTFGLPTDQVHYTSEGVMELGRLFAAKMIELISE